VVPLSAIGALLPWCVASKGKSATATDMLLSKRESRSRASFSYINLLAFWGAPHCKSAFGRMLRARVLNYGQPTPACRVLRHDRIAAWCAQPAPRCRLLHSRPARECRAVGCLEFRRPEQPDHATLWRAHRELSAWFQDRRSNLPARRLCRWRAANADGPCCLTVGDVWVMNNWQDIDSCFGDAPEELSTRCGGQGVVIFFGMAKPVSSPQIGPARQL